MRRWLIAAIAALSIGLAAAGQMADVYLKSGLKLRGDITDDGDHITLRNQAGAAAIPKDEIERIVPLETPVQRPESQPTSRPADSSTQPATQPAAEEEGDEPESTSSTNVPGLPAPPVVSARDITRLKLSELALDTTPAEELAVKFLPGKQQQSHDLLKEVLAELQKRQNVDRDWERILTKGKPGEKLQLIVRETGLEYADRIDVAGDPAVFATFRRRVVPLLARGCARSGCHGSVGAELFRFPAGAKDSDAYVYTSFVLTDRMRFRDRPLMDRIDPSNAPILKFFVGVSAEDGGHPAVSGKKLNPPLKSTKDPQYAAVVAWLNSLRNPHPNYRLDYDFVPPQLQNSEPKTPANSGSRRKSP